MVAWITLTPEQLDTAKAAAMVDALAEAALRDGQANPLPEIIESVTARIRAEIAGGGKTRLSRDASAIPPSLKSLALRMVLREGQSRLNVLGGLPLADDERKEWDHDIRYLERIARGEITVEEPSDAEDIPSIQSGTFPPMISARKRQLSRRQQDGI